ncbi:MAG TPA: hypothetical protein VMB34_22640 [Acetobacteraceae bacterium]|nr:hypothetical protein [Acetobacteraceae bacterium]
MLHRLLLPVAALLLMAAARTPDLPNPDRTPGAIDPAISQSNIGETICNRDWSTRYIRPPEDYTYKLKRNQLDASDYRDRRARDYEEDHLISLELGGAPTNPRNLWPEHWRGACGAHTKDRVEDALHRAVCKGRITLRQAQWQIATNWIDAYRRWVGPLACGDYR